MRMECNWWCSSFIQFCIRCCFHFSVYILQGFDIKGRIYLNEQGINAQVFHSFERYNAFEFFVFLFPCLWAALKLICFTDVFHLYAVQWAFKRSSCICWMVKGRWEIFRYLNSGFSSSNWTCLSEIEVAVQALIGSGKPYCLVLSVIIIIPTPSLILSIFWVMRDFLCWFLHSHNQIIYLGKTICLLLNTCIHIYGFLKFSSLFTFFPQSRILFDYEHDNIFMRVCTYIHWNT